MTREFPNQLNQKEVIQLANGIVPDLSITFESNQQGQYGNQEQFMNNQNIGHVHQQYWVDKNQAMTFPHYYHPYPCCCWMGYSYY